MLYPKIGSIQVAKNGTSIVYVWPNEYGTSERSFCGASLLNSDISCCWDKRQFEYNNLYKKPLIKKFMELRKQAALKNEDESTANMLY